MVLETSTRTRRLQPIAPSGQAQTENVEKAHVAGFDLHLAKHADLDFLLRAIGDRPAAAAGSPTTDRAIPEQACTLCGCLEAYRAG